MEKVKNKKIIITLSLMVALLSAIASTTGIFSSDGEGSYEHLTIRGEIVEIYGKGIYKEMSSGVAVQGIAHDYVTLFIAIPLLLISLFFYARGCLRAKFVLSGTLLYFLLTYLFYTAMAMFNYLFLIYVALLASSFFGLTLLLLSFDAKKVKSAIRSEKIVAFTGWFMIFNSLMIALLWLSYIIKPLLSGDLYPQGLDHYTTVIVQGLDLGIFLPLGFVSGLLAVKRKAWGAVLSTVYVIFLSILMMALTSKIVFMARVGIDVFPVIFIMPTIATVSTALSVLLIKSIVVARREV